MPDKPLGRKAYGSIGHLPCSRIGPGDHHVTEGQARIATEKARDRHDVIIVQEKLDGSCVAICMVDGKILALGRSGYLAQTSPYEQHQRFAAWVRERESEFDWLREGERVCGEWLLQAHGTRYELSHSPFVAFDLMIEDRRLEHGEFLERIPADLPVPHLLHIGGPYPVENALRDLQTYGYHGALDPVEGAVWRVERDGKVDFLAKYVRNDKVDGGYLPEITGQPPVWNWYSGCAEKK